MTQWGRPPHSPWRLYPPRDPIRAEGYWSDHGIRKSWILYTPVSRVGLIDEHVDTTYGYDYLGQDAKALADLIAGKGEFAKKFAAAKRPLIIVGSAIGEYADGPAVYNALAKFVENNCLLHIPVIQGRLTGTRCSVRHRLHPVYYSILLFTWLIISVTPARLQMAENSLIPVIVS